MSEPSKEVWGVVANIASDRILRKGARVLILDAHCENARVVGLARNSHMCEKWTKTRRLRNFRAAFVPAHQVESIMPWWRFASKEDAAARADIWNAKDPEASDRERFGG